MYENIRYIKDYNKQILENTNNIVNNVGIATDFISDGVGLITPLPFIASQYMSAALGNSPTTINNLSTLGMGRIGGFIGGAIFNDYPLAVGAGTLTGIYFGHKQKIASTAIGSLKNIVKESMELTGTETMASTIKNYSGIKNSLLKASKWIKYSSIAGSIPLVFNTIKRAGEFITDYQRNKRNNEIAPSGASFYDSLRGGNKQISMEDVQFNSAFASTLKNKLSEISQPALRRYNSYLNNISLNR